MRSVRAGGLMVAAIVAAAVACSDSGGPSGGLTGSYTLDSLKLDTNPTLFPPLVDGSLVFGSPATFAVVLNLHPPAVPSDSTIALGGTYTLAGTDSIYLDVFVTTIPGTQVQTGNKLVLDVLIPAGLLGGGGPAPVHLVWHK